MGKHRSGQNPYVSMKSGLEGRNNLIDQLSLIELCLSLNEVRPRRPEQLGPVVFDDGVSTQSQ